MDSCSVVVYLYKGDRNFEIPILESLHAEDVCRTVAKFLQFRPISLCLFSIRLKKSPDIWLPSSFKFQPDQTHYVEFRLRFKIPCLTDLNRLDENAFDYTFHQIRHDLLQGHIPDISQDQVKSEALGLCVTDMLRLIQEEAMTLDYIEANYKQFIPKSIYRQHKFFLKKKIHDTLVKLVERSRPQNSNYIKEQYISQVEELAPRYFAEEFYAMTYKQAEYPATIRVNVYHTKEPGVSVAYMGKHNWDHICTIEDLCFISIRGDCTAEISRKNGIPICFKFKSQELAHSFVSMLDGYYRLSEKWTFNLCKELPTPSLSKLKFMKCHGPVGDKFAHQKLTTMPITKCGSFILRESSKSFDSYCIDYLGQNKNRPFSCEINGSADGKYTIKNAESDKYFTTLSELVSYYMTTNDGKFVLKECLPPSEYDQSPLLLCRKRASKDIRIKPTHKLESTSSTITGPQIIVVKNLQVFRGKRFELEGTMCNVYKGVWKESQTHSYDIAIKVLKKEHEEKKTREFLEMADRCAVWQCESLLTLRGIVLVNPLALVMDWMPLGALDVYLKENVLHVEVAELIEAASHIAKAVWFLEDHGIVHGNIRCHNVLVAEHSESAFIVKLADPSIVEYSGHDVHWIPPEFFEISTLARNFMTADVWSLGTTLWEVFSYGEKPPRDLLPAMYKSKYMSGWRLPCPRKCPLELYRIISECWAKIPESRKHPQAIVRDIHQILYQLNPCLTSMTHHCTKHAGIAAKSAYTYQKTTLIGTKRTHSYASITPESSVNGAFDTTSMFNWGSFESENQNPVNYSDGTLSTFIHELSLHSGSNSTQRTWLNNLTTGSPSPDLFSGFSGTYNGSIGTIYSTGSAQGIYVFGKDQITLGRMIGQGCYGAVYVGELVRSDGSSEPVAVKMMKEMESIPEKEQLDFHREFEILKNLCHPNIVEVKGVVNDPGLLLIMEYLPMGSLLDYFRVCHTKPYVKQLLKFAQDVAEGMDYLRENNIVHRDLAARNILVANEDLVKISDFGLARYCDDNCYTFRTDRKLPIKWYPPESLQYHKSSEYSDIWSYGVTLYEIFSLGKEPNLPGATSNDVEVDEIFGLLTKGVRLPCPENCPDVIYSTLMLPCWQMNPTVRPNFSKILGDIREIESLV
ncbi:tyrosine-protein kinase JAK2 isoform X2 [Folsomia candida]|nr:tyrosine-protein kinase JAK2 isoform X2 [Folsomia candida]XP_035702307.1 tyrosine-protein kinase JAK2 isoform X2 [Folsomia candida]XP_035702308.1 tyrosine-protein kinase JAK2 isoform X2 [Folsomia candida]